ncbi:hypothetical protein [Arthrobacter koreensis]|uniref:hypothetical protein n=1 Tax=Arthrobacter koreensis TaxID=199136 RepID=UPI00114799FF|nr:hypothetical protein [Arthrobacter koreensis]
MTTFDESDLKNRGFLGFQRFRELDLLEVPREPGVYAVLRDGNEIPDVLDASGGGWFKGRNPTMDKDVLTAKLSHATETLYIGKADKGKGNRGLRKRIAEFVRFGNGEPVGHWGGCCIWQLADPQDLRIAWLPVLDRLASEIETELIEEFVRTYSSLPFANLRR